MKRKPHGHTGHDSHSAAIRLGTLVSAITLAAVLMGGSVAWAGGAVTVIVRTPPPPPRVEIRAAAPGPNQVWIAGHWRWNGRNYAWFGGRWVHRPSPRSTWVPGHWAKRARVWVWIPGHWE